MIAISLVILALFWIFKYVTEKDGPFEWIVDKLLLCVYKWPIKLIVFIIVESLYLTEKW